MSVRPCSNAGRIFSAPSASCLAPRPFGISFVFLKGLLIKPIGCGVNMDRRLYIKTKRSQAGKNGDRMLIRHPVPHFQYSMSRLRQSVLFESPFGNLPVAKPTYIKSSEKRRMKSGKLTKLRFPIDSSLPEARGDKSRRESLLPALLRRNRPGRRRALRRHINGERQKGWRRIVDLQVVSVLVVPAVGQLERRLEVHRPGLNGTAMPQGCAPPRVPRGDDACNEIAHWKGRREHLILLRSENGDGAHALHGIFELRRQAVVVDGRGHERDAADRQAQMGDGS